jgi:hypothetical protein
MRIAFLSALVVLLAVPAGWGATRPSTPSASLSIEDGRGTVVLTGKGIVIGRLDQGELKIVDLSPLDQWSPRVNGVPRGRTVWLRGKDVNFYVPGGRYKITVRGDGFSISARGQGSVTLTGSPGTTGDTGKYAVGDATPAAIPSIAETVTFGLPLVGDGTASKGAAP